MIVSQDKSNSVMIASLSTISTPSSSTSSFEEATCTTDSRLAEEQSLFHEASLAQAECDDDLEEDCEPSKKSYSNFEFMDEENQDEVSDSLSCAHKDPAHGQHSKAEQNLANEAKEYWATIDFYNSSKVAFNKRLKSVKSKREKLNFEMRQRRSGQLSGQKNSPNSADESRMDQDLCNCVKCSIIIHEALIQGLQNVHEILCKKCHSKLNACKCILSRESSISQEKINLECNNDESSSPSLLGNNLNKTQFNHFEDKLFNIKNELVNLSETSLDVFQLLLQLSDTVLDLNNQLSSSTNVNQLFLGNSNSNLSQNLFSSFEARAAESQPNGHRQCQPKPSQKPNDSKSNKIENFLQKNFYSTQAEVNAANKHLNNSITTIINKINSRSSNQKIEQLKKVFSSKSRSRSPHLTKHQPAKLIENVCDKTSVTQFVDSLLNCKSGEDLSRASSGFYSATSLLTMINQEDATCTPSLSDTSHSYSIKQTPNIKLSSTTTNIIARQIKNPSSSNIDLSESKSFRHSILSTSSSNTDSSTDHTKSVSTHSPKSKEMGPLVDSGGLGAASRKKSGSNNTLSSSSSCTSPVPTMLVNGARKPSFKFENNTILNKVQNMNIKSKYSSPQNLNGICEGGSLDKRCSLMDRQSEYDPDRCVVKRQQSVKCHNLVQTPVRSESSLDSGINFTSENDESKIMISSLK